MKKALVILIVCVLTALICLTGYAARVAADELWIRNEGGLEISVWSDTDWTEVSVSGAVDVSDTNDTESLNLFDPHAVVGPSWTPEDGKAKVVAVSLTEHWLVIHADNITHWEVEAHCNQNIEYTTPEIRLVTSAELEAAQEAPKPTVSYQNYDSGPSIQEVMESEPIEVDWTGQDYWLYT